MKRVRDQDPPTAFSAQPLCDEREGRTSDANAAQAGCHGLTDLA